MSFNDVYLGERELGNEIIKEVKKLTYDICRTMIDPLIGSKRKNTRIFYEKNTKKYKRVRFKPLDQDDIYE